MMIVHFRKVIKEVDIWCNGRRKRSVMCHNVMTSPLICMIIPWEGMKIKANIQKTGAKGTLFERAN